MKMMNTKASRAGSAITMQVLGRPVWTPRNYTKLAEESYNRNAIAFRCVHSIATAAAAMPILAFEGKKELSEHPFLTVLRRPNPFEGRYELMTKLYSFILLSGNAYLEPVILDSAIRELFSLRPDRMSVIPGSKGYPQAYQYKVGGQTVNYPITGGQLPIIHIKTFHPTDDFYGLSAVEPAAYSIDIHNQSSIFGKALLDNSARPSGALVYSGGETGQESLSDEQYTRLKTELEQMFQGARNAGRPMLLEGGLDWKTMSITPKDLEFVQAKNNNARDIALSFGVPAQLLGIPGDNTYTNFKEAQRAFYRMTVIPLVNHVLESLSNGLTGTYGPDFMLRTDLDSLEALADERKDLWDRVNASKFITLDEKREATGYGLYVPGQGLGDKIYAPMAEMPIDESRDDVEPGGAEDDDEQA
jgi:HK97 family phage portal protein